ncbi:MAG: hypothetical protein KGM24_09080 [Elusimicrobia bacterium]|nr:hypothetical protein [Elusimicrobiota bacterium]
MKTTRAFAAAALAAAFATAGAGTARAAVRDASVPNNFVNVYVGFNKMSNTDIHVDATPSLYGLGGGNKASIDFNNAQMNNTVWGGFGMGHWIKQYPFSIGFSGTMDFFPASVKEQTFPNTSYTIDGVPQTPTTFTKYQTDIFQVVPAFNLIAGVPLGIARVYGGIGPALFMSIYSFTMKGGSAPNSQVTAFGANVGFNAFFGGDFFITKNWSAFVEGKYSQVNNLSFTPDPSQIGGRNLTETYKSLVTQRVAVGASYHF